MKLKLSTIILLTNGFTKNDRLTRLCTPLSIYYKTKVHKNEKSLKSSRIPVRIILEEIVHKVLKVLSMFFALAKGNAMIFNGFVDMIKQRWYRRCLNARAVWKTLLAIKTLMILLYFVVCAFVFNNLWRSDNLPYIITWFCDLSINICKWIMIELAVRLFEHLLKVQPQKSIINCD